MTCPKYSCGNEVKKLSFIAVQSNSFRQLTRKWWWTCNITKKQPDTFTNSKSTMETQKQYQCR